MKQENTIPVKRTGVHHFFQVTQGGRASIFVLILSILSGLSTIPASLVEVFLRREFGERYISLSLNIVIALILVWWGIMLSNVIGAEYFILWFLLIGLFLYKSIQHRKEIKRYGTAYDFERFSLSDGRIHDKWWDIIGKEYFGVKITRYLVHIILEPLVPIIIGLPFLIISYTRSFGLLLIVSGLFFGFRAFIKAYSARSSILDIIDEQICMKYDEEVLVEQKSPEETAGLSVPIELPEDEETRRLILNSLRMQSATPDIWEDDKNLE
jgi:hypothetical protein